MDGIALEPPFSTLCKNGCDVGNVVSVVVVDMGAAAGGELGRSDELVDSFSLAGAGTANPFPVVAVFFFALACSVDACLDDD